MSDYFYSLNYIIYLAWINDEIPSYEGTIFYLSNEENQ